MGIIDDTIIIFTSDHGEYLGVHLRYQKGYPGEDCISRVPCIFQWNKGIVEAVDVLPTILESVGIPIPPSMQDESFHRLLANEQFEGNQEALMEFQGWKNLRTKEYIYLCESNGKESLYDLRNDPM